MTNENEKSAGDLIAELAGNERADVSQPIQPPAVSPSRVVEVTNEEEFNRTLNTAQGPVLVDFTQDDCPACEGEGEKLQSLAECQNVTVMHVKDSEQTDALFEKFGVEGTPTLLYAKNANEFTPEKAKEVEPDEKLRRKLKCSR